jgi:predicted MFS family arabinose efflux permease
MQQVRLVAAAPQFASASVSLNMSVLYVGQAIGSFVGGLFYEREFLHGPGFVAAAFAAPGRCSWSRASPEEPRRADPEAGQTDCLFVDK